MTEKDNRCKAGGIEGKHPNYNLPHVAIEANYNGKPAYSCKYCGKWMPQPEE